ncbi:hypothetical protein PAMP_022051 [Pampus punctatissimus]
MTLEEGELIVEGLLNIFWGLRRPIRLQMQDDHERIRPPPSSTSWHSGCNLDSQGSPNSTDGQQMTQQQSPPTVEVTPPPDSQPEDNDTMEEQTEEDSETSAQLLRTKSDAGVLRRGQRRSPSDQRKIRRHRFSINGHFYNHKVAQYIKFEMPVLQSFIIKLKEEEDREVQKLRRRGGGVYVIPSGRGFSPSDCQNHSQSKITSIQL